jgi:hypothetical protein
MLVSRKRLALTGISIHRQCRTIVTCQSDDSESMLIIKASEWNEENIRHGCTLLRRNEPQAAREVRPHEGHMLSVDNVLPCMAPL